MLLQTYVCLMRAQNSAIFFCFVVFFCIIRAGRLGARPETKMEKCATGGGRNQKLKLKKHALPAIEAVLKEVRTPKNLKCNHIF